MPIGQLVHVLSSTWQREPRHWIAPPPPPPPLPSQAMNSLSVTTQRAWQLVPPHDSMRHSLTLQPSSQSAPYPAQFSTAQSHSVLPAPSTKPCEPPSMHRQRDTLWRGPAAKHEPEQARASQSVMVHPSSQWNPVPVQVVTSQSVTQQLEPQ